METYDSYISSQVMLPRGDEYKVGQIIRRKRDHDGNPIGKGNHNPILDTRIYEVKFGDGEVLEYAANVIAENIYSQVDDEGHYQLLLDEIVDHKK